MEDVEFKISQPIDGVPVMMISYEGYKKYIPMAAPANMVKVSDNESYAVYKGDEKTGKLTVKTSGSGDARRIVSVTFEEVTA